MKADLNEAAGAAADPSVRGGSKDSVVTEKGDLFDNTYLSEWLSENAFVTWKECSEPWLLEKVHVRVEAKRRALDEIAARSVKPTTSARRKPNGTSRAGCCQGKVESSAFEQSRTFRF
jgi:hypothetical protein